LKGKVGLTRAAYLNNVGISPEANAFLRKRVFGVAGGNDRLTGDAQRYGFLR